MTKDQVIDIVNSVLKDHFSYVPLYDTLWIVNKLIEKGVIKVDDELKERNLIMSMLQEYAETRKKIGEEKFSHISKFLDDNPHYFLSDVYYRESVWNEFETWEKENF